MKASGGPPTWLLGGAVALLGWRVGMNPPGVGLDASWNAGLAMAVKDGLQFGSDVVFSYGPLGFMQGQLLWYGDLAVLGFLWSAALYLAFCTALVWTLRRRLPALAAVAVAFLISVLPLLEQSIVVAVLVCMRALEGERSERTVYLLVVGGASYAAVEALIKLSTGPLVAVVFLIALVGLRARWWQVALYLALLVVELLLFWLLAGQAIAGIPDFLGNTWEVVSGYSAAMSRMTDVPAWKVTAATLAAAGVTLAMVLAGARARYRDDRARWSGALLIALVAFATFKQGVVRTDAGHLSLYFSTACALWVAIPWRDRRLLLAGAAAIALMGIPVRPPGTPTNLDAVANVRYAAAQARTLLSSSRRAELIAEGRAAMTATYRLDRRARAALRGRTVAVEPWEIGAAWAYGLDWDPLPVFQNYSAYTPALDRLNAEAVASASGPERILREDPALVFPEFPTRSIDDRFPGWDPPAQARQVLCHFAILHSTPRWQVLGRTADRCGPAHPAGSVDAGPGSPVPVPAPSPGEVVFARIEGVDLDLPERMLALLFRAPVRHAFLDGDRSYRLVPGTAEDGLLLRGGGGLSGSGAFAQIPQARTIAVTGTSGGVRFEFFRMRVRDTRPAPADD